MSLTLDLIQAGSYVQGTSLDESKRCVYMDSSGVLNSDDCSASHYVACTMTGKTLIMDPVNVDDC